MTVINMLSRGISAFGISGPHWKKSCLGPQTLMKTDEQKKGFR